MMPLDLDFLVSCRHAHNATDTIDIATTLLCQNPRASRNPVHLGKKNPGRPFLELPGLFWRMLII